MFSKAVLADVIDCEKELRDKLKKVLYNYVMNYFSRGNISVDKLTVDSGELNSFEVVDELDVISFKEEESGEEILVSGLIPVEMTVDCFKYSNNENMFVGALTLKRQVKFSFTVIPDETKNPYGSEFKDIEFFDVDSE